jgi:hypothetical protein
LFESASLHPFADRKIKRYDGTYPFEHSQVHPEIDFCTCGRMSDRIICFLPCFKDCARMSAHFLLLSSSRHSVKKE